MEINKILSADLLDLVFDDRNKAYGAYELRRSYPQRVRKALVITFTLIFLAIGGAVLAKSLKPKINDNLRYTTVEITELKPEEKKPEEIKPPEEKPKPEPTRTEKLTNFVIKPNDQVDEPPPTNEDLKLADIGDFKQDGKDFSNISDPPSQPLDNGKGILDEKNGEPEDKIYSIVQVEARYAGNWEKFLLRNLNGSVPVDNGAPPGRHTVIVQFIVDKEGNVSDIQALSNVGFGMEEEAIRVLKRADKWEPAIQAGYKVKAYRVQRITFEVLDNELP